MLCRFFLEKAKYIAILLIVAVGTAGCNKTILADDETGEEFQTVVEDEKNNSKNAKLKRISSIH